MCPVKNKVKAQCRLTDCPVAATFPWFLPEVSHDFWFQILIVNSFHRWCFLGVPNVDCKACRLSRVNGTLFLERHVNDSFCKFNFPILWAPQVNSIHPHVLDLMQNLSETNITKPLHIKLELRCCSSFSVISVNWPFKAWFQHFDVIVCPKCHVWRSGRSWSNVSRMRLLSEKVREVECLPDFCQCKAQSLKQSHPVHSCCFLSSLPQSPD